MLHRRCSTRGPAAAATRPAGAPEETPGAALPTSARTNCRNAEFGWECRQLGESKPAPLIAHIAWLLFSSTLSSNASGLGMPYRLRVHDVLVW